MTSIETDWSRAEFKAYVLAYAAKADYIEEPEEIELIKSAISDKAYNRIHRELEGDNDYQAIQKILHNLEKYNYSKDDLERLIQDIKDLFMSDGNYDILEQNMLLGLKRLLS